MQQEEKAVFILKKCSYEELQAIQHREDLLLSGWTLLEKENMDVTEKVYDEDGTMVALINYYFLNENKDRMMIALFELFKPYRGRGKLKRIHSGYRKGRQFKQPAVPCYHKNKGTSSYPCH